MMKKKVVKGLLILTALTGGAYIYFSDAPVEHAEKVTHTLQEVSNKDLLGVIQKYENVINEIRNKLRGNYGVIIDAGILPNEKIELIIKIPKEVEKTTRQKIEKLTTDVLKQNKFDPNAFQISVVNYYESTENSSVRLSYYDVIGYMMEEMNEKGYGAFSIEHKVTPENINIMINMTEEKTNQDKEEVQEIARNIIKQNGFNLHLFQIDVTNNIINN